MRGQVERVGEDCESRGWVGSGGRGQRERRQGEAEGLAGWEGEGVLGVGFRVTG